MKCPTCNLPMIRDYEDGGRVIWRCKSCGHIEDTPDLSPPFYEEWKDED